MTASEKTKLVMKGMSSTLVLWIDGLGWSFDDTVYLLSAGMTPAQIEGLLSVGGGYPDIRREADNIKRQTNKQKLDKIEKTLFGEPTPIVSNVLTGPLKTMAKITEETLRLGSWGLFKLGRAIAKS